MKKEYEVLCSYLKESNFNIDGSPSNDDDYHLIVKVKTDNICKCFDMIYETDEAKKLFATEDYVEDTLEPVKILSCVGHELNIVEE